MSAFESPARLASTVYPEPPGLEDPAELYHEASKLTPATAARVLAGAAALAGSPALQQAAARASLRHTELPRLRLPRPAPLAMPIGAAIERRRSARAFGEGALRADALAALLEASYGVTGVLTGESGWRQRLRAAPSGGALYPLDVYVSARRVSEVEPGSYRYDPLDSTLERVGACDGVTAAIADGELAEAAAVTVVYAATLWRSRFKYGLRAYRFALLEAGHAAQNLLLAATALGVAAVPLGGFFDHRLDEALELDGVDRASLYVVCAGALPERT